MILNSTNNTQTLSLSASKRISNQVDCHLRYRHRLRTIEINLPWWCLSWMATRAHHSFLVLDVDWHSQLGASCNFSRQSSWIFISIRLNPFFWFLSFVLKLLNNMFLIFMEKYSSHCYNGLVGHSAEVAFALLTQQPRVRFLAFPRIFSEQFFWQITPEEIHSWFCRY